MSINPSKNSNSVPANANITITFDQNIDGATLNSSSIIVKGSMTGVISGTLTGAGGSVIGFNPTLDFKPGERVTVTITKLLKSLSAQTLTRGHTYGFTAVTGPPPVTPPIFAKRHVSFNVLSAVHDVTAIDFEQDGDMDFVTSGYIGGISTKYTLLWENDGNQNFCYRVVGQSRRAELLDIDGDGDLDAFAPGGNEVNLVWYRNENDGGPFTQVTIASSALVWTTAAGDLDSDGDADVVAPFFSNLLWYKNNGSGVFTSGGTVGTFGGGSYSTFRILDVNKDGAMDVVGYKEDEGKLVWFQNNGSESFTEKNIAVFAPFSQTQYFDFGDIDDDGDLDFFVGSTNSTPSLIMYKNDGAENFTAFPITMIPGGTRVNYAKVTDVDGDLDMDLLSGAFWFENDGSENFTQNAMSPGLISGNKPFAELAHYADLDGDGDMDLLTMGAKDYNWLENNQFMNVSSTTPANGTFGVAANANITVSFTKNIDGTTINNKTFVVISKSRGIINGVYSGAGTSTVTFNPTADFLPGEEIEVSLTPKIFATTGENLQINYGFDFRTKVSTTSSPSFTSTNIITHATTASGMDIADMDGDGDLDLISCSSTQLFWHQNNGSGVFTSFLIPITTTPKHVAATDFNKDGKMDIHLKSTGADYVYLNDGSQNFSESLPFSVSGTVLSELIDVDRDGDVDAMTNSGWVDRNCTEFKLGFVPPVSGTVRDWRAGDLDNDGDVDLLRSASTGSALYLNDGFLNFTNSVASGLNSMHLALADLDNDSDLDAVIVVTNAYIGWAENRLNTPSNDFAPASTIGILSADPRQVVTADFDGDGDADVGAISRTDDKVVWYKNQLNEATNDFGNTQLLPTVSDGPIQIRSADLNADGTLDIIVLSDIDNELNWYANNGSAASLPTISGFAPVSGFSGTTVTITGTNFSATPASNVVKFNGTPAVVTASTTTSITTTVPVGATTGTISVTVAGNTATSAASFTVGPTITSFSPTIGIETTSVTITGTNFSSTPASNTVKFNGTTAVVTGSTTTSITTTVPGGATTGKITVKVGALTATSTQDFTVVAMNIDLQPLDFQDCEGQQAVLSCHATGTTNITYQWQFSPFGPPSFVDVSDGPNYSGASTGSLSFGTLSLFGEGMYRCRINGDLVAEVLSNEVSVNIYPLPSAPGTSGATLCAGSSFSLTATGGVNGDYRWYTVPAGGTAIVGEVNDTYITPLLQATTTYYVSLADPNCEGPRSPVTATVIALPASPLVTPGSACSPSGAVSLGASGGANGEYRWYTAPTGGPAIPGETNNTYTTPVLTSSTSYYVSIDNGTCESIRTPVMANILSCTPTITAPSLTTQIGGSVQSDITTLVTTVIDPLDINSIKVVAQPASGAVAVVTNGVLMVDYAGIAFAGTDLLTIEACDIASHCSQLEIAIDVAGDIVVFNALSPNDDGKNDLFFVQYIDLLPETKENKMTIFDRTGNVVFEVDNYDNNSRVFRGLNNSGNALPAGTYYYRVDFKSGMKSKTGFISLKK